MKRLFLILVLITLPVFVFGQAKKPSLMVVPSDLWCNQNGYMTEENSMGEMVPVPDYRRALINNTDLLPVISRINGLMADRGFPLKNLELRQRAKADIIVQLTWTVNQTGPKRSVTYTLQGLDSYTNKEIATTTGTGEPSFTAELPVLLAEAVSSHMDEFCDRLQNHFDDLLQNGREISLNIRVFENSGDVDLETEYDGKELREIIEDWVYENTVEHRFNLADDSEVYMNFDEVRIPLYDDRGRAMAASNFARELEKYLKGAPFNIPIKRDNAGLGLATLYLFK